MNRNDAAGLVTYAMQLWDAWKPSDALIELMADIFAHDWLSTDAGRAIIVAHRKHHEYLTPNPAKLTQLVAAKRREILLAESEARRQAKAAAPTDDRRTIGEWRIWYTETDAGRREWATLEPEVRRGLRTVWRLEATA